jgi:transposase InsO family protein
MDRDSVFCASFRATLRSVGVLTVRLPPRSPNLNAHLERFHGSIKAECLDRLILFGETMLRNAIREYLLHYHRERNHQGLGNRLIDADEVTASPSVGSSVGNGWEACSAITTETPPEGIRHVRLAEEATCGLG